MSEGSQRPKITIQVENMAGRIRTGRRLDVQKMIDAGGRCGPKFPGARFDVATGVVLKAFPSGVIIAYGARSRESMWRGVRCVLDLLGVPGDPDRLEIFMVVAKAGIGIESVRLADAAARLSGRGYRVMHDSHSPFPGVLARREGGALARLYRSGVVLCGAPSEEAARETILDVYRSVLD